MAFKECPTCLKIFNSLGYAGHRAMHRREVIKEIFKLRKKGLSDKQITEKLGLHKDFIKYWARSNQND